MFFSKKDFFFFVWLFSSFFGISLCAEEPTEFFIVICSYNNIKWCKKNLDSVFSQTYPYWHIYYVDACSTDGTGETVDKYIKEQGFSDKCTVVHKTTRTLAMENTYFAIKECDPHKVVVQLDGDDWLAHTKVLEKVAAAYKDLTVWMTYGSFRAEPSKYPHQPVPYPEPVQHHRFFRRYKWLYYPLRTFYAALFHKIAVEDLLYEGDFVRVTQDMAFSFPMLEMASKGHLRFIHQVLYIYNCANPLSDFRCVRQEQRKIEKFLRSKRRYKPLLALFEESHFLNPKGT